MRCPSPPRAGRSPVRCRDGARLAPRRRGTLKGWSVCDAAHPLRHRRDEGVTGGLRCLLVDLFEYQARDLLASHGVPVLPGGVAETPEQAEAIAREIGTTVVVKAQVKT